MFFCASHVRIGWAPSSATFAAVVVLAKPQSRLLDEFDQARPDDESDVSGSFLAAWSRTLKALTPFQYLARDAGAVVLLGKEVSRFEK